MGIKYDCGAGLVDAFWAKANCDLDAYVLSSGPSLKYANLHLLKESPVFSVGINTTYPKFKPNMWVGLDYPKCFNENLWFEPFTKVCRIPYVNQPIKEGSEIKVKDCPNVYFATSDAKFTNNGAREIFKRRAHKALFVWENNTLATALNLLIWMGYKKIHLLGSDFGGDDYFDDSESARPWNHDQTSPSGKISKAQRQKNEKLWGQQINFIKDVSKYGKSINLEIISCSPGSPINEFLKFKPLEQALEESAQKVKAKLVKS